MPWFGIVPCGPLPRYVFYNLQRNRSDHGRAGTQIDWAICTLAHAIRNLNKLESQMLRVTHDGSAVLYGSKTRTYH